MLYLSHGNNAYVLISDHYLTSNSPGWEVAADKMSSKALH
jgi:hypothetical protein